MTNEYLVVLIAGAFAGGFVNGLAGFGTSLFALGWWLQIMPLIQAVAVVLLMSVASGIPGLVFIWRAISGCALALFLIPALAGIPIGLQVLHRIDAEFLKIVIAGFLLLYGGFFLLRGDLPNLSRPIPVVDSGIGFAGGILGAIAGLSGALPTMWLAMHDCCKEQSRAILQPFNVVVLAISAMLLAWDGAYDRPTLTVAAIALPATMIAA